MNAIFFSLLKSASAVCSLFVNSLYFTDTCLLLQGGLTLLLINLSNSTVNVAANLVSHSQDEPMSHGDKKTKSQLIPKKFKVPKSSKSRFEYHLSAPNQDLHSQTALLNGIPLEVTYSEDLPNLDPIVMENSSPILVGPLSIVFVVLPDAHVPICKVQTSTK